MNTFRARKNGSNQAVTKSVLSVAALGTAVVAYAPGVSASIFAQGGVCGFQEHFGWKCPFCGMTHAVVAFLHGDLISVFRMNPFAIVYVIGLIAMLASLFSESAAAFFRRIESRNALFASVCLCLGFLSYAVGRNVPA